MSDLRDTISRAIRQAREFQAGAAFGIPAESYGRATDGTADAVIAALGLGEECLCPTMEAIGKAVEQ